MTKELKLNSVYFLVLLLLFVTSPNQILSQDKTSKINELMIKLHENEQFNGAALVSEHGKIIYKKGFGYADMSWKVPNEVNTKFKIGSITKQFVAMRIMQLVEDEVIKLDGKLADYIPEYRKDIGAKVTIHHLLTHTSGIPSYTDFPGLWTDSLRIPYETNYIVKNFLSKDLDFEPGTEFYYNNSGYFLLAVIIEKVTGKSFEENIKESILNKINMKNTGVVRNEIIIENMANGYQNELLGSFVNAPYTYMQNILGAGDMYSTVEDLFLWDQALDSEKLLSNKSKEIMFNPYNDCVFFGDTLGKYGYGWIMTKFKLNESSDSVLVNFHGGTVNGFETMIFRLIKDKHLIVLFNNINVDMEIPIRICNEITNILYDKPFNIPKKSIAETIGKLLIVKDVKTALEQYHKLKANNYDEYIFQESELNYLGYMLLSEGKVKQAIEIFKLNTKEYPNEFNTYDSLGEAYLINGEEELAKKNYKKSLELNPDNTNATKILNEINKVSNNKK